MTGTKEVHDVLVAARALIAAPERWCKGAVARTQGGLPTTPCDPRAVAWCANGACICVAPNDRLRWKALDALQESSFRPVPSANDAPSTTHADILALFDKAIEATRAVA